MLLLGRFENDFDVGLPHPLAQIPVHNRTAEAVQHATQVVERPRDVDVAHVDVPMLMRLGRLLEAGPFLRRFRVPLRSSPTRLSYAPHAGPNIRFCARLEDPSSRF